MRKFVVISENEMHLHKRTKIFFRKPGIIKKKGKRINYVKQRKVLKCKSTSSYILYIDLPTSSKVRERNN